MGFFSNKLCPICGTTTPKLLAKKFDGQPICSTCAKNILADDDLVENWSLEDLRAHLNARAQNLKIVENFTPTRTVEYDHEAVIDDAKRMFYINSFTENNPPVFRFDDISGFSIELGCHTVEHWSRGMARVPFQPMELGILGGIAALAEAFLDDDDNDNDRDSKYEDLTVTLKVNTPYLHEYELCDLSVSGRGRLEYTNDLACEMSKVNTICNLIISLTI